MKISNELLSWVLGCECEFLMIVNNDIIFRCEDDTIEYVYYDEFHQTNSINLHTFIHIAKIKAFDNHYDIKESVYSCVYYPACKYSRQPSERIKAFKGEGYFDVNATIEALEWVVEKVGGKDVK